MAAPDFVVVGHVTLDHFDEAVRPGGTALYAAVTAQRLGMSVGILTSHGADFPLEAIPPQIEVVTLEAPATTVFEHRHRETRRALRVTSAAQPLGPADVPEDWRDAGLVLLAPVVGEVDPGPGRDLRGRHAGRIRAGLAAAHRGRRGGDDPPLESTAGTSWNACRRSS